MTKLAGRCGNPAASGEWLAVPPCQFPVESFPFVQRKEAAHRVQCCSGRAHGPHAVSAIGRRLRRRRAGAEFRRRSRHARPDAFSGQPTSRQSGAGAGRRPVPALQPPHRAHRPRRPLSRLGRQRARPDRARERNPSPAAPADHVAALGTAILRHALAAAQARGLQAGPISMSRSRPRPSWSTSPTAVTMPPSASAPAAGPGSPPTGCSPHESSRLPRPACCAAADR